VGHTHSSADKDIEAFQATSVFIDNRDEANIMCVHIRIVRGRNSDGDFKPRRVRNIS
jgi:hypothetical protein